VQGIMQTIVRVRKIAHEAQNQSKHGGTCEAYVYVCKQSFRQVSITKLFALLVICNFGKNHDPSGNFKGKHPFKALC